MHQKRGKNRKLSKRKNKETGKGKTVIGDEAKGGTRDGAPGPRPMTVEDLSSPHHSWLRAKARKGEGRGAEERDQKHRSEGSASDCEDLRLLTGERNHKGKKGRVQEEH